MLHGVFPLEQFALNTSLSPRNDIYIMLISFPNCAELGNIFGSWVMFIHNISLSGHFCTTHTRQSGRVAWDGECTKCKTETLGFMS